MTAEDYRRFAEQVEGVAKASVLPLHHPHYPAMEVPGAVTVVVVPDQIPLGPDENQRPIPTQDLLERTFQDSTTQGPGQRTVDHRPEVSRDLRPGRPA